MVHKDMLTHRICVILVTTLSLSLIHIYLEEAAKIIGDRHIADGLTGIVVPGSRPVKEAAEAQGLDKIFKEAGFEWREPGCSACLGMNPDQIPEYVHCASTSNRNFEGRQGHNARTHLCSPAMAAAAAIDVYKRQY